MDGWREGWMDGWREGGRDGVKERVNFPDAHPACTSPTPHSARLSTVIL